MQSGRRADIWFAYPGQVAGPELAELLCVLSPAERHRAHRFLFERDRVSFVVTRALLRSCLSRYADVPASSWEFEVSRYGKPRVKHPEYEDLHFNVSHTRGLSVCIIADAEAGIDVENVERRAALGIMQQSFSAEERRDVLARAGAEQNRRFFAYWTVKEAYSKARGMGMALSFDAIGCRFDAGRVRLCLGPACADDAGCWEAASWAATPLHQAAAVVRRGAGPLRTEARWGLPQVPEREFQSASGGEACSHGG